MPSNFTVGDYRFLMVYNGTGYAYTSGGSPMVNLGYNLVFNITRGSEAQTVMFGSAPPAPYPPGVPSPSAATAFNGTVQMQWLATCNAIFFEITLQPFQVLETNVTVSYDAECLVLQDIGHTCPTVSVGDTGSSASWMRGVELVAFQATDYYAGNFSAGFTGPYVSHDVWFTNSTIFCVTPLLGNYATCPVDEPLPSVSW